MSGGVSFWLLILLVSALTSGLCVDITVATCDPGFTPYVFRSSSEQLNGFDVDLWRLMTTPERLNLPFISRTMSFSDLMAGVSVNGEGSIDVAVCAIFVTAKRELEADYSHSEYICCACFSQLT